MGDTYEGPVVFSDGVHFPVDEDGHPDLSRPLRHVEGSTYRDATGDDALHNEGGRHVDIEMGDPDDLNATVAARLGEAE